MLDTQVSEFEGEIGLGKKQSMETIDEQRILFLVTETK